MNSRRATRGFLLMLLTGLFLLLYPSFSDCWNNYHQSKTIAIYEEITEDLNEEEYIRILEDAKEYNAGIQNRSNPYVLDEGESERYRELLNVTGNGAMGYLEIPSISCILPVYHDTEETVLQYAIGHLPWSSLPVGGESTHCVISGHCGLPRAKLFTDLDELAIGDIFILKILNEKLLYEVDRISIVEPHETEELMICEGKDYCTMVTCTPYGVNSHRLLVRGQRIEENGNTGNYEISSEAVRVDLLVVTMVFGIPMTVLITFLLMLLDFRNNRKEKHV